MKFLVTGAAGMIGANLVAHLAAEGHTVHALDRFSNGNQRNLQNFQGFVHEGDIRTFDYSSLGSLDAIFHQAAITDTTVASENLVFSVNVDAFVRILDYAKESGCPRVIYASSAATYGKSRLPMREGQALNPANIYGVSKVRMEEAAHRFAERHPEVCLVGLRYFNVYGPFEFHKKSAASMLYQLYSRIAAGKPPRVFKWGEQFRDFVYVKDVVQANMRALEYQGIAVFNVGTGIPFTFNKIIELLNRILGADRPTEYIDNPYTFYQEGTQADIRLAAEELGFRAAYPPEKGMPEYVDDLKSGYEIRQNENEQK